MFRFLNGEFAFVLWDSRREELLLARDRFGIKPVFHARHQGAFVFASEAKGLLALEGFSTGIDPLHFTGPGIGLAGCARTPFIGITSVRPGHLLRVGRAGSKETPYWTPTFERGRELSVDDAAAELRKELGHAVERRVGGGVPIALALSSGIDSAIIAGLTARVRPEVRAFCISYPGAAFDESAKAARTAAHFGLEFEPVVCTPESLAAGFLDSIRCTETATNSLSTAARISMTAAVRRSGAKALAGGEGSDEIFGGYPYFGLEAIWRRLASGDPARRSSARESMKRFRDVERLSRGVFWDDTHAWRRTASIFGYPSVYAVRATRAVRLLWFLASRRTLERIGPVSPLDAVRGEFDPEALGRLDPFDATRVVSRSIFATFVVPALGDRVEMAHSLEGRAPYLDVHVVRLAYSLTEQHCLGPDPLRRKHVLRRAFADLIPADFAAPPKHTFMAPTFRDFVRTPIGRDLFETLLSPRAVRSADLLDGKTVSLLRMAASLCPASSQRFALLDGLVGYCLSVQALHNIFVGAPPSPGPLLTLDDRSRTEAYAAEGGAPR